jgi:hypothetical protein
MVHLDNSLLLVVSQEVMPDVYVLSAAVFNRIIRHADSCHTRFWKANRMRTMYVPGSAIHVHSSYITGHHHTVLK